MKPQTAFRRKIVYLVAIVVLLGLLSVLGRPATRNVASDQGSRGGVLAQLRDEYEFSQAQLGEIDLTGETIRLATLGLRGVGSLILWEKANTYKMKKDWTNLSATLEQITHLQPNFLKVWTFQAWNIAYNVSREFDDFRQRYRYVIRGIEFLKKGLRYNRREPKLVRDVGWFIAHKIGRSDERLQFRELFKNDDDFHGSRPKRQRDNWLVAKEWFAAAEKLVADGASLGRTSRTLFYSDRPLAQMRYAEALEKDGNFDDWAQEQWAKAHDQWIEYGNVEVPAFDAEVDTVRLNDYEKERDAARRLMQELENLAPEVRGKILEKKRAELTDEQRAAYYDVEPGKRTDEQYALALEAQDKLRITAEEIAAEIRGPKRSEARDLAKRIIAHQRKARIIRRKRSIVSFEKWRRRAEKEQLEATLRARELVYLGEQARAKGDLEAARDYYQRGSAAWRAVLEDCMNTRPEPDVDELDIQPPPLIADRTFVDEAMDVVDGYLKVLDQLDEQFPEDFPLHDFVHAQVEDARATRLARIAIQRGNQSFAEASSATDAGKARKALVAAREAYEEAWSHWNDVLEQLRSLFLLSDRKTAAELTDAIERYAEILAALDELFPENFVLQDFVHSLLVHFPETETAREYAMQAGMALARANDVLDEALRARREGNAALEQARKASAGPILKTAREASERALPEWRKVLDKFPSLIRMSDRTAGEEMLGAIRDYGMILEIQQGLSPDDLSLRFFPEDFPLRDFLHVQVTHAAERRAARKFVDQAEEALEKNDSQSARIAYDRAWTEWRKLLDKFPMLWQMADPATIEELLAHLERYQTAFAPLGQPLSEDYHFLRVKAAGLPKKLPSKDEPE